MIFEFVVTVLLIANLVLTGLLYWRLHNQIEDARMELVNGFYADIYKDAAKSNRDVLSHLDSVLDSMGNLIECNTKTNKFLREIVNDGK